MGFLYILLCISLVEKRYMITSHNTILFELQYLITKYPHTFT